MDFPDASRPIEAQTPEVLHAMMVWGEARGEPSDGKTAVAYIPLTRAKLSGNSLSAEILRRFAFSCFNMGDPNRYQLLTPAQHGGNGQWAACWKAAASARDGTASNPAQGATHYVVKIQAGKPLWDRPAANPTYPKWFEHPYIESGKTKLVAIVGSHVFATTPWSTHV